jgi:hypothetical protein
MPGRVYVFINLDETSISSVTTSGRGLVAVPKIKRDCGWTKPLDRTDRTNVKTSLMAAVCDCPKLQPFLPQVILPKYTKRITPPPRILNAYANTGGPFEYWHRSTGWPDCQSMIRWATRLRSVVSSFNPDVWIILMMDCSYCHLNIKTIRHLRRLGILVVIIPAKLTWLVQLLDVYVFSELKSRIRAEHAVHRLSRPRGSLEVGSWIDGNARAIREIVVDRDWQAEFAKLGAGDSVEDLNHELQRYVSLSEVSAALPTRAQFCRMVSRPCDTDVSERLHAMVVGSYLDLQNLPLDASPSAGALIHLPYVCEARKRRRSEPEDSSTWEEVLHKYFRRRPAVAGPLDHMRGFAQNIDLPVHVAD